MANFWDEDGTSGWAVQAVEAAKPVTAKPSKEEMQRAWNENKGDPAKIHELMQANGVGVREVSGILGARQSDVSAYLNSGRKAQSVRSGAGDELDIRDVYNYDEVTPERQTKDEFMATVEPWMLDAQGKFKRPQDGVNYRWEGMTPDQVFATKQPRAVDPNMERDGAEGPDSDDGVLPGYRSYDPINLKWEPGPDNGGGILGGVARGIGGIATGVAKNPALMAAVTAGMAPMVGEGLQAAGMSASTAKTVAPLVLNAGKTLASGGSLGDAALSAAGTYVGGQTSEALGGGILGQAGGSIVSGLVSGKDPLQTLVTAGANAAAGAITGSIPGFDALPPSQQSAVNSFVSSALRGKSPTQALISSVTKLANGQVASAKPKTSNTKTGGWSA
jgi:hypothetical protein